MVSTPCRGGGANVSQLCRECAGGSLGTGRVWTTLTGQEWVSRQRETCWSSRLGVGRWVHTPIP